MKRLYKGLLISCLVTGLLVAGGMRARRAYKRSHAKNSVARAMLAFEQKDLDEAAEHLKEALQSNPSNVDANRMMAELLERTGSPASIGWRIRAAQLEPANMINRLDWAQTAVRLHDLKSAQDALSGLDEQSKSTARYHKVAAALAWSLGKADEAREHYQEARRLEPGNPSNILNLATSELVSTNEQVALQARLALQNLATNSPLALTALRHLALDAGSRKAFLEELDYSKQLVTNSSATVDDKLDYLNLLRAMKSTEAESWLVALKEQTTNSPAEASALGRWMAHNEGPGDALRWLSALPAAIQARLPVPMVIGECQMAVKDWPALASTLEREDWGGEEPLRMALQSLAARSMGKEEEAQSLWAVAKRDSTRRLDMLYTLTQLTGTWGWAKEQRDLLKEVVSRFPREKWAVQMLAAQRSSNDVGVHGPESHQ